MCPVFSTNLVFLCLKVFETSFQNRINFLYNSRFLRLFCLNYIKSQLHFQLFSASMKSDHFAIASSDWNGIQSFFQTVCVAVKMNRPVRKDERGEGHPGFSHRIPQQQGRYVHHLYIGNRSAACRGITCRKDGYCIMRKRLNRVLSAALSAVMLLSLWPTAALAAPTTATKVDSISAGDLVVISSPSAGQAMGTANKPYKGKDQLAAVTAPNTDNAYTVQADTAVLRVYVDEDDNYVFQNAEDGRFLYLDGTHVRLTEERGEYTSYQLEQPESAAPGNYFIKSVNASYQGKPQYLEHFGGSFTCYGMQTGKEDIYTFQFHKTGIFSLEDNPLPELPEKPPAELPFKNNDTVVIYNVGANGVLAGQDDNVTSPTIENAAATVSGTTATPANGGRVFTAEQNGEWWRFKTEHDGYLCSNGTGSNSFYSKDVSEDADWKLTAFNGGFSMMSRTAKYQNSSGKINDQYLEYYSDSYKTYSLYNDSDKDIYTFQFYTVDGGLTITDGVVNAPVVTFGELPNAYVSQDYTVSFTVDAVFGVKDGLEAKYGETPAQLTNTNGTYSFTIPGNELTAGEMTITVTGTDTKNKPFTGTAKLTVVDEPVITAVSPAAGSQTGDNKQPTIQVDFANAGENPTVVLTLKGPTSTLLDKQPMTVQGNSATYAVSDALSDGRYTATVTVTRTDSKSVERAWSFLIGTSQYQLYFGQLHSHTAEYSDGAGTLQEGLDYVANLPENANVDFVAFTDHSNYFDTSSAANPEAALYDPSQMTAESRDKWNTYTGTVAAFNEKYAGTRVALAGFEMTWSGGPGHINTFNTPGLVSRNNKTLNSKESDAGMKAYYELLKNKALEDSISQFNHPGATFGTFADFAYYDPVIDSRMHLVEVGNGEGAIGSGGYFPSYSYYIMALDKGWHVAPTNNQDNHKGKWGNANDARDVVLTDNFSQDGIYEAIRNYRVYATEDKNLEINYTLNDQVLGSIIEQVPETVNINVSLFDPDASDSTAKVEVVVNTGKVAHTWSDAAELAAGNLSCTLPADYTYYFIRVTQSDGDIAVTAPVWVGETLKLGISSVECGTSIPVTGEAVELKTNLFNSESTPATIQSITYTSNGQVLGTQTGLGELAASSTQTVSWDFVPTEARLTTITVAVTLVQDGKEFTYTSDITLDVLDAARLVYVGIDASHHNEYVNGNYNKSMGNFSALAAGYAVRTVELNTSADLLAACENANGKYRAIVLTAPSRRDGDALRDPYDNYSDEEIAALKAFNAAGGMVILAGWSDYYESYKDFPEADHMAAQQNKVLEALGSSLRISDDATVDDTLNGGQSQRLYLSTYNWDHFLMEGVEFDADHPNDNKYSQLFSQYGGASIYAVDASGQPTATLPETVAPVVYGHATTYSKDSDQVGVSGAAVPTYPVADGDNRLMILATEELPGQGLIVVSGAAFLSNFEVQAQVDSAAEKNYSNYNICENLVNYINPTTISPISEVQAQKNEGVKYTIEGIVTSNASGYDKDTAFFDCIYLQDDTAGINAFPVAGNFQIGDRVRITGTTSSYQGERQIAVSSITKVGTGTVPAPKEITAAQLNDRSYLGSLVTLRGTVVSFESANGLIQTILVRDSAGTIGRVFIDGYITKDAEVQGLSEGRYITATGLASYDTSFAGEPARIRIRNRADIVCSDVPSGGGSSGGGGSSSGGSSSSDKTETVTNPDGSTTTTVTKSDGTVIETTKRPDGSSVSVETKPDGTVTTTRKEANGATSTTVTTSGKTTAQVNIPADVVSSAVSQKQPVSLPLPALSASSNTEKAPAVTVGLSGKKNVAVEIPVANADYGTVAMLQKADGSLVLLRGTLPSDNGVTVSLSDGDTVKLVNNARSFSDIPNGHWSSDSIDFVTSRELFNGTSDTAFSPSSNMTRGMLWTVLARMDGVNTNSGSTWYEAGRAWAMASGISDGTNVDAPHTREQLVTMLWRYAGSPAVNYDLSRYSDSHSVSDWAKTAMAWAVEQGLIQGSGNNLLTPDALATREQVATILTRFVMTVQPF